MALYGTIWYYMALYGSIWYYILVKYSKVVEIDMNSTASSFFNSQYSNNRQEQGWRRQYDELLQSQQKTVDELAERISGDTQQQHKFKVLFHGQLQKLNIFIEELIQHFTQAFYQLNCQHVKSQTYIHKIEEELDAKTQQLAEMESNLAEMGSMLTETRMIKRDEELMLLSSEDRVCYMQNINAKLTEDIRKLNARNQHLTKHNDKLTKREGNLTKEHEDMRKEIQGFKMLRKEYEDSMASLEQQLESYSKNSQNLAKALNIEQEHHQIILEQKNNHIKNLELESQVFTKDKVQGNEEKWRQQFQGYENKTKAEIDQISSLYESKIAKLHEYCEKKLESVSKSHRQLKYETRANLKASSKLLKEYMSTIQARLDV